MSTSSSIGTAAAAASGLQPYALDTLENLKAYLGVGDDERDGEIESLINERSQFILRETGREFAPRTPDDDGDPPVTRVVGMRPGSQSISLAPFEAREVTAIVIAAGTSDASALVDGDWMLDPITNTDGVWGSIVLRYGVYYGPSGFPEIPVTVTGRWGWPAVPDEVRGWLHRLVEDRWRGDVTAYADADGSVQSSSPVTVEYAIRQEMSPWQRVRVGAS